MRILPKVLLLSALAQLPLIADELELSDGGKLSGVIRSITPEGIITADLHISESPVELRANKVTLVQFGKATRPYEHDSMLTLTNGDRLPCDLIAISESELTISTSYAGTLTIPRKIVATAQLGIRPRKTIYSGPKNLKNWEVDSNWHYEDGAMVSDGRGSISREFGELPDSFSFAFRLKWAERPMLKVFFSSESPTVSGGKHDRYYLQVGTAGIELKRQNTGKNSYHSLITVNRTPDTFSDSQMHIEVHYDHRQQRLQLYIDGQLEGQAEDPLPVKPKGRIVILQSDSSDAEAHRVSEIVLRDWNAAGERHRSEDRGDFGEDSLINNKGERFGGRLIGSEQQSGDLVLLFKSPLAPDALIIPSSEVSTLFFKDSDKEKSASTSLVLGLAGAGSLGASSCDFGADEVKLTHPLLGELTIKRSVVKLLERRKWPEDQIPQSESEE